MESRIRDLSCIVGESCPDCDYHWKSNCQFIVDTTAGCSFRWSGPVEIAAPVMSGCPIFHIKIAVHGMENWSNGSELIGFRTRVTCIPHTNGTVTAARASD